MGAAIRDAPTPLIMRLLYRNGDPARWILEHRAELLRSARPPPIFVDSIPTAAVVVDEGMG